MDLTSLTASDLRKISSLIEKKSKLSEQIAEIDKELASFGGSAAPAAAAAPAKKTRGRKPGSTVKKAGRPSTRKVAGGGRRGAVKDAILSILQSTGSEGVSVKDIAARLGQKPANIHAWFQATGKKTPEIKKVGKGTYAWVG